MRDPLPRGSLVAVTLIVTLPAMVMGWYLLANPSILPPKDFVEYWAAARVALDQGDPYDGEQLLPLQRAAANEPDRRDAVMMWNPPWTLPVYYPLALLSPRPAQLLWLALQVGLIVGSSRILWKLYGGPREHLLAVPLIALTFYGSLWTIKYGQNTGLLLFGLAGFAYFDSKNRPALAGACAALTALKPHLLAVFGLLLVLNVMRPRGWVSLVAGGAVIAAGLGVSLGVNPEVLNQYLSALRRPANETSIPLSAWQVPLGSFFLRQAIDATQFWIQFVPCAIACIAYFGYFLRKRSRWNWAAELPCIVWVSILTAPYGGWIFDLVVLLVPVIQASTWLANEGRASAIRLFAAGHLVITGLTFVLTGRLIRYLEEFWWAAPATLILWLSAWAIVKRETLGTNPPRVP